MVVAVGFSMFFREKLFLSELQPTTIRLVAMQQKRHEQPGGRAGLLLRFFVFQQLQARSSP